MREAIEHLQKLIQIDTSNPPGNEAEAVSYISKVLREAGVSHQIFEPKPGRASLIARLPGNGSRKPLLINAHLDVVGAQPFEWKFPPFSGEIQEGAIWGRGAVDMKNMAAMILALMVEAKRENKIYNRDLIFAAVADEEEGCEYGSRWLVENKPQLLEAEYAFNEVGGFSLDLGGQTFFPIGVAEKGLCWLKATFKGEGGHGSLPHPQQAAVKMGRAAFVLGSRPLSYHAHPVMKNFIDRLSQTQGGLKKIIFKGLLSPYFKNFVLRMIPKQQARSFSALLHNTASPTILKAGEKINVIPTQAQLHIDGRVIPGSTVEEFMDEVRKCLGDDFHLETILQWEPTVVEEDPHALNAISQSLLAFDPGAIPVPYLNPGFTDSAHYKKLGIKCYGFAPVKLPAGLAFSELFHGPNERIPVDGFLFGLNVLREAIGRI